MKTLTTMTAVAALIAGMSIAGAQTNNGSTVSPSNPNAAPTSEGNTGKSGMQPTATQDMRGSSTVMPGSQAQSENPANLNEKPTDGGSAARSGTQSPATADMPARGTPRATTGTSATQPTINPSAPNAKPNDNAGGTGK